MTTTAPIVNTRIPTQLFEDLFADDVPGALKAVADFLEERFPDLDCSEDLRRWAAILHTIRLESGIESEDEIAGVYLVGERKPHWRADGGP